MKRVVTALLLIPFAIYCVFYAPAWAFSLAALVISSLCFIEFRNLARSHKIDPPDWASILLGAGILLLPGFSVELVTLGTIAIMALSLRRSDLAQSLPSAAAAVLGVIYIFGAWRCGTALRETSSAWLFFALSINWVGDTAAMYVGKAFGKHRLAPRVSPGKSWEGTLGSLFISAALGSYFLFRVLTVPWPKAIVISLVANIAGQLGDLAESAFKRGGGVKDSGTLLPGHGGWLDRLDSSLFSMPAVYALLRYWP